MKKGENMEKKSTETVEDIMKQHLSILENSDKVLKLEKDAQRDKKIIQELKEREKVSARTIVLFERKLKYLKETIIAELLKTCKENQDDNYFDIENKLYDICNKIEQLSIISASDKAFILDKPVEAEQKGDAQSRFDKLKADFNQKIGSSVLRKPGRPKKEDQSIVANLGLGKKVEKVVDSETETQNKLKDIFYGVPNSDKKLISTIPQTEDSLFDFAEALNPNNSLQDIMQDIIGESESEFTTFLPS